MAAEAKHADVHAAAAAYDRHIARDRAVYQRATVVDEGTLTFD
jgi:hypothetical protein